MTSHLSKSWWRLVIVFVISFSLSNGWGREPTTFLIAPFKIHSDRDSGYLQNGIQDMLVTRLTSEQSIIRLGSSGIVNAVNTNAGLLDEQRAAALGAQENADYVVYGSLTIFGNSISTNARCVDVSGGKTGVTFTRTGQTMGDVIQHIDRFSQEIQSRILAEKPVKEKDEPISDRVTAKAPETSIPKARRHPEAVWRENKSPEQTETGRETTATRKDTAPAPETASVPASESKEVGPVFVWRSPALGQRIIGLSAGDVDGDGHQELVAISKNQMTLWRFEDGELAQLEQRPVARGLRLISVDVGDINGNQRDEIFLTAVKGSNSALSSMIIEWNGRDFDILERKSPWYYRVDQRASSAPVLYGQRKGRNVPFDKNIFRFEHNEVGYVKTSFENLPGKSNLFTFARGDVRNEQHEEVLLLTPDETLQLRDTDGVEIWTGGTSYTGGKVSLQYPSDAYGTDPDDNEALYYLPPRIHIRDLNNDGKNEVIIAGNTDAAGGFLQRTRLLSDGRIHCLSWRQTGLYSLWKTRRLDGHISDIAVVDIDKDGAPELVATVIPARGFSLSKPKSHMVVWDIRQSD